MTLEEFRRLADTWGGDVERWPQERRQAARALAGTPAGRAIVSRAARLDALLAAPAAVSPERAARAAGAVARRLAAEQRQHEARRRRWRLPGWLLPAASVASSALLGVALASALPAAGGDSEPLVLAVLLDSGSITAGWTLQ